VTSGDEFAGCPVKTQTSHYVSGGGTEEDVKSIKLHGKEKDMIKSAYCFATFLVLTWVGAAGAQEQFPMMEQIAQKVIQKYETASCEQLAMERSHPPTGQKAEMEQRALQILRTDPQMRTEFINRVAAPIANKLFECGMIP
jgi:hypothetical protein